MDTDWIKAVMLLCMIEENNTDLISRAVRYVEIMSDEYGLDAKSFRQLYDIWYRTGEVSESYRQNIKTEHLPLYHRGLDGMCRMMYEGVIDEELFFESFSDMPYETLKDKDGYTGFYPGLPGCIGFAENEKKLDEEMKTVLRKWIREDFSFWHELKLLEE